MDMEKKVLQTSWEVKDDDSDLPIRTFRGRVSVYDNVDSYGDVVVRGAYDRTMKQKGNKRVILANHDPAMSIGIATLTDRPDGLWVDGQLMIELPSAMDAYVRLKRGILDGMSIGYETVHSYMKSGNRFLTDVELWECSLVQFPANSAARVTTVKRTPTEQERLEDMLANLQSINRALRAS